MIFELNQNLFNLIYNFNKENLLFNFLGIFLAKYLPYLLVILFFYNLLNGNFFLKKEILYPKKTKIFLFLETILVLILSRGIVTEFIRFFWPQKRPFDALNIKALIAESGPSLPSGHAAFLFALAAIVFLWNKKWGIVYFVFAFLNGLARIYVGVHWPLDILAGALVGIISAVIVSLLFKKEFAKIY